MGETNRATSEQMKALTPVGSRWWHVGTGTVSTVAREGADDADLVIMRADANDGGGPERRAPRRRSLGEPVESAWARYELLNLERWWPVVTMTGKRPAFPVDAAVRSAAEARDERTALHGVALDGDALALRLPRAKCAELYATLLDWQAGGWGREVQAESPPPNPRAPDPRDQPPPGVHVFEGQRWQDPEGSTWRVERGLHGLPAATLTLECEDSRRIHVWGRLATIKPGWVALTSHPIFQKGDLVFDAATGHEVPYLWRLQEHGPRGWAAQLIKRGFPSELEKAETALSDRFMEGVRRYKPETDQVWQLSVPSDKNDGRFEYLIVKLVRQRATWEWLATVVANVGDKKQFTASPGSEVYVELLGGTRQEVIPLPLLGSSYNRPRRRSGESILVDEARQEARERAQIEFTAGALWHFVDPRDETSHRTVRLLNKAAHREDCWAATVVDDNAPPLVGTKVWVDEEGLRQPGWIRVEPIGGQVWIQDIADERGHRRIAVRLMSRGHPTEIGDGWEWWGRVLDASDGIELPIEDAEVLLRFGPDRNAAVYAPFCTQFDPATWTPVFDPVRIERLRADGQVRRLRGRAVQYQTATIGWEPQFNMEQKETPVETQEGSGVETYAEALERIQSNDGGLWPMHRKIDSALWAGATTLGERLAPILGLGLISPMQEDTFRIVRAAAYDILCVRLDRQLHRRLLGSLRDDLAQALPLLAPAALAQNGERVAKLDVIEHDIQAMICRLSDLQKMEEEEMRRRRSRRTLAEPGLMERAGEALGGLAHEGGEAAWNVAAIKAVDWGKSMVVGVLSKKLAPGDKALRGKIAKLLNTDGGTVFIAFGLSGLAHAFGAKLAPALGIDSERLDYLGRRLRVMGMTQGGVALVDGVLAELQAKAGPLIAMLRAMPTLPNELPVPRVRDGLRDDPDVKVAEVAVPVAANNKAVMPS